MKRSVTSSFENQCPAGALVPTTKRVLMIGVLALIAGFPTMAQNSDLQQRLAFVKQAMAENKQRLQQYQWIETTQLNLKGEPTPPTQNLSRYCPDGQVQKTPIGPPPQQPSVGRLKERITERKNE